MAAFTLACAFHDTDRLLALTLPRAIRALTVPTRHEFEVVLVADRSSEEVVARLLPRLADFGVDELRFRRGARAAFSGAPSNNFHGHHFAQRNPYLITFTDDTFIEKEDEGFDVLDAVAADFRSLPDVPLLSKVHDHEEWDHPLVDVGAPIAPGIRSVNRVVDQLIAYDTRRFGPVARRFGAFERDAFTSVEGFEYQWENLAGHVGTTGGRRIACPESWPLRVRHCDLRVTPGSMHGTQDEDVKIRCYHRLAETAGREKV
jgi:hypothetical protein